MRAQKHRDKIELFLYFMIIVIVAILGRIAYLNGLELGEVIGICFGLSTGLLIYFSPIIGYFLDLFYEKDDKQEKQEQ